MAGQRSGHTSETGGQLELDWEVPPATPATTDFVCWLWAAFPPREGRLHISRIAKALGVPPTTLRRWIARDDPKLRHQQVCRLHQRAILRGHGHYLWPDLDPVTRRRSELLYADALRNDELITSEPERVAPTWHQNGTLSPHVVQVVYFPKAHVFGVSAATHDKARAKVKRHGEVIERTVVPNRYAAIALKHEILNRVDEHRCITPRHLVPTGRTETWREIGGPAPLRRPLRVTMVRFAGLPRFAHVGRELRQIPNVTLDEVEARNAGEAAAALIQPADVTILTSHGYTRASWRSLGTRRPWPGGPWYAGDRRPWGAGTSIHELLDALEFHGGIPVPRLLVIDAGDTTAAAVRRQLRNLTTGTSTQLVLKSRQTGSWRAQTRELAELVSRTEKNRDDTGQWLLTGLRRYRLA
jgi:hypothetical protein